MWWLWRLALRLSIVGCPVAVAADVQQQILEGRSVFDDDLRNGEHIATAIARRFTHDDGAAVEYQTALDERDPAPVLGEQVTGVGA